MKKMTVLYRLIEINAGEFIMQHKKELNELERVWSIISHDLSSPLLTVENSLVHMDEKLLPILLGTYKTAKNAGLDVPFITNSQLEYYQELLKNNQSIVKNIRQQIDRWNHKLLTKNLRSTNQPMDIVKCVKSAIENYQSSYSLADKSLIHTDLNESNVIADENVIQYVIFELLSNAEYAIEANVDVNENPAVFILSTFDDKNYYLAIKNKCVPIASSDLQHLFDPYFSTKISHIGLGLTFCKQAMKNMQGDIVCRTEDDGKTVEFLLSLPLVKN